MLHNSQKRTPINTKKTDKKAGEPKPPTETFPMSFTKSRPIPLTPITTSFLFSALKESPSSSTPGSSNLNSNPAKPSPLPLVVGSLHTPVGSIVLEKNPHSFTERTEKEEKEERKAAEAKAVDAAIETLEAAVKEIEELSDIKDLGGNPISDATVEGDTDEETTVDMFQFDDEESEKNSLGMRFIK